MRLFLPQSTLEEWLLEDKADLRDGQLHIAAEGGSHPAEPAVHFVQLASGEDTQNLLHKVKPESQLEALGAERVGESVLLGDTAYEVIPGYLTEVALPVSLQGEGAAGKPSEQALLEAMFLNKL